MIDQADKLRKIMKSKINNTALPIESSKAKVIAISSGKGGVGKTTFALNFAISLKRLGYEVVIIDADIGLSNIEILSGINIKHTISDIVFSDKDIFEIMGNGPEGVKIISGGSGIKEFRLFDNVNFVKLITEIEKLQSVVDYIIIDTGAGISPSVTDFIMVSNEGIILCTPDPTSIMDSYTLIKSILHNGYKGRINVVVNLVNNRNEGKEIFDKLYNAVNNFLKVQINYLGYMNENQIVSTAVKHQIPFIITHPNNSISKRMNIMAMSYLDSELSLDTHDKPSLARKILDIFSNKRWWCGTCIWFSRVRNEN